MYHSPGLRDGVSSHGFVCANPQSYNLGAEINRARIILAGNKFDRAQVFSFGVECATLGETSKRQDLFPCQDFLIFTAGNPPEGQQ